MQSRKQLVRDILSNFVVAFSVVTLEFQENSDKYIGWMEAASGLGLTLGPALGSVLYDSTSYQFAFVIQGTILLLGSVIIAYTLPERVNFRAKVNVEPESQPIRLGQARYPMFLRCIRCLFTLLGCTVVQVLLCFLDSIVAVHLSNPPYNVSDKYIGYIFVIPCFIYTLGCPIMSWAFNKVNLDRRLLITISFFVLSISLLLTGPSYYLSIPQ